MTTDNTRAIAHIRAVAEAICEVTAPGDESPAAVFMSGMLTGLAAAKKILDGAGAEQALEDVDARIALMTGQTWPDGTPLPKPSPDAK